MRLLTVWDLWKTKSLKHQVFSDKKRKKMAENLFTEEYANEAVPHSARTPEAYLAVLHTYLLALSIAGTFAVDGAPQTENYGDDPVKYVCVCVCNSFICRISNSPRSCSHQTQTARH